MEVPGMSPLALEQAASEKKEIMVSYPFNSNGHHVHVHDPSRSRFLGTNAQGNDVYLCEDCKVCYTPQLLVKTAFQKAYYEANKDKAKAYYEANKDKITANMKAYREANKDKITANMKAYREANKDKAKAYYEANKDKITANKKAYYEANKDKKEQAFLKARGWARPVIAGKKKTKGDTPLVSTA